MIAAFMMYTLLASLLLAVAGWGVESVLRSYRIPTRFVWIAALLGTTALASVAPLRFMDREGTKASEIKITHSSLHSLIQDPEVAQQNPELSLGSIRNSISTFVQQPFVLARGVGEEGARALFLFWITLTAVLLTVGVASALRYRAAKDRWPRQEVDGVPVRLASKVGPAVVGLLRPEIVIPTWLLDASPEERRLALLHEKEHLRAGDSWTLALGCALVLLFPWNPAIWWMLLRLRLAVEVDCDTRVLRQGVETYSYGSMLIDVSGQGSGLSLSVPALAGFPSTLEQRLRAMTAPFSRRSVVRSGIMGAMGVAAALVACDAQMPTSAEIEAMGVEEALAGIRQADIPLTHEDLRFFKDGVEVSREEAMAIGPDEILEIRVEGQGEQTLLVTTPGVHITTRSFEGAEDTIFATGTPEENALNVRVVTGEPLYLIDHVPATTEDFNNLTPNIIQSISVLKDESAASYGERARNGVVLVTTKEGSPETHSNGQPAVSGYTEVQVLGYGERERTPPPEPSGDTVITVVGYRQVTLFEEPSSPTIRSIPEGSAPNRNSGDLLYLIDNVPGTLEEFNRLRPEDIKTVSVLGNGQPYVYGNRQYERVITVITNHGAEASNP